MKQPGTAPVYGYSDEDIDSLYSLAMQRLAKRHWTPAHVARLAADYLTGGLGDRILDIGSGAGKFCLAAACHIPGATFYGVEQRAHLIKHAERARQNMGLGNVHFINSNFTQIDLRSYDHFYFYNSFYEHLEGVEKIDDKIDFSETLYNEYVEHLFKAMADMPVGTRIATYHAVMEGMPRAYERVQTLEHGDLVFWIKRRGL